MTTTGDLEPLASGGDGATDDENENANDGHAERAIAYLACPVCREPIPLPTDELPPRLVCEACGAILER